MKAILLLSFLFSIINAHFIITVVNDIHLDLKYDPTVNSKSRCQAGLTKDPTLALYGRYGCDSPYTLYVSALKKMKEVNSSPNLVIVPGDIVTHTIPRLDGRFDKAYYEELKIVIANYTATIAEYFPDVPIIFTQGNDDYGINYQVPDHSHRDDYYEFVYNKTILEIRANNISDTEENRVIFKRTGCYATIIPEGVIIISVNAMHFSVRNRKENDPEGPSIIFQWFEKKLEEAKAKELKVILTYHIPHGVFLTPIGVEVFWVSKHEETLKKLMSKYSDIISGVYTGHMHLSTLNVSYYQIKGSTEYYAGVLVNRAISPIFSNNPGFALYHYIDTMDNPKFYEEYTFSLAKTYNKTDGPENYWKYLYSSLKDLEIENLSSKGIYKFLDSMVHDLKKYLKYMVLRLGIDMHDYESVDTIVRRICEDNKIDTATYIMCIDSLNEHVRENY